MVSVQPSSAEELAAVWYKYWCLCSLPQQRSLLQFGTSIGVSAFLSRGACCSLVQALVSVQPSSAEERKDLEELVLEGVTNESAIVDSPPPPLPPFFLCYHLTVSKFFLNYFITISFSCDISFVYLLFGEGGGGFRTGLKGGSIYIGSTVDPQ